MLSLSLTLASLCWTGLAHSREPGVGWYQGEVEDGLRASASEATTTLLYFTAAWCPSCQKLQAELLATPAGAVAARGLRAIKVDVDAPGGQALVGRFVILGYPSALLLASTGEEIGRVVGFEGPAAWSARLEALKANSAPIRSLRDAVRRNPADAQATLALGRALLERDKRDEGEALLQLVAIRWPGHADAAAEALWCLGRYYHRVRSEPVTAQHIWRELAERYGHTTWAGGAWWWYAKAQVALGRVETGAAALEAVAHREPGHVDSLSTYVAFLKKHTLTERCDQARRLITEALAQPGERGPEERAQLNELLVDLRTVADAER